MEAERCSWSIVRFRTWYNTYSTSSLACFQTVIEYCVKQAPSEQEDGTAGINRLLELVRKIVLISISWVLRLPALDIPRREAHGCRCVGGPMLKWLTNMVSWPRQVQGHLMPSQRCSNVLRHWPCPWVASWDPRLSAFHRRRFLLNKHHV